MLDGITSISGVDLFIDEYRSPIYVDDVLHVLWKFIHLLQKPYDHNAKQQQLQHILVFNMGGPDRLSRYEVSAEMNLSAFTLSSMQQDIT